MNFRQSLEKLREVEYEIMSKGGEYIDGYDELSNLVKEKATSVASFLATNRLGTEMDRLKEIKKEITKEIKNLNSKKEYLEQELHNYIEEYGVLELKDEVKKYVVPSFSITNKVDEEKTGDNSVYEFKVITKTTDDFVKTHSVLKNNNIEFEFKNITKVTDLPKGHPALITNLRPKIKFVKSV